MKLITDEEYNTVIPFAYIGDCRDLASKQLRRRARETGEFIGLSLLGLHTLDIGAKNAFGQMLWFKDNTLNVDLNFEFAAPSKDYEVVGCFEIIEHIMNPLNLLINIRNILSSDGTLFLSSPRPFLGLLQGKQHFFELKKDRMIRMARYAGLVCTRVKKIHLWDWHFMFYGFRPLYRVLFHRSWLYEFKKMV